MRSFKQYITEVLDVKPKVNLIRRASYPRNEYINHEFKLDHPSLKKPVHIDVLHEPATNIGHVDIYGKGERYETMGKLGTKNMMHVLGRIKHHIPNLESLHGDRLTGARNGEARDTKKTEIEMAHVNVKHVKPIPPEDD